MSKLLLQPHEAYVTGGLDALLRGSLVDDSAASDSHLTNTIENFMFLDLTPGLQTRRFSLGALNINRGRDHGLRPYNAYRVHCGLKKAESFEKLTEIPKATINDLIKAYRNVDDIDLWTGIISERPMQGAVVGPTGGCK